MSQRIIVLFVLLMKFIQNIYKMLISDSCLFFAAVQYDVSN